MKQRSGLCMPPYSFVLLVIALWAMACKKQGGGVDTGHAVEVRIHHDERSALAARIEITALETVDVEVRYRKQGSASFIPARPSLGKKRHLVGLVGLQEKTAYEVEIRLQVAAGSGLGASVVRTEVFTTASIPESVSSFYQVTKPDAVVTGQTGHYLFASMSAPSSMYIIDGQGKLVWYQTTPHVVKSVHMTERQTLLSLQDDNATPFGDGNIVLEQSLAGDTLFYMRLGQRGFDKWVHHDLKRDAEGNFIAITNVFKDNELPGDGLVKWSSAGNKLWEWSTFDVAEELDPDLREQPWINSIFIDHDGHYLLSLRALSQVWKIDSKSGKVKWKLGKGGDLALPEDAVFLKQHYAHRSINGDIMLFDNGDATRPYSRVLSLTVDETQRNVKKNLDVRLSEQYYSPIMGSAKQLPDGHILVASSSTNQALKLDQSGAVRWILQTKGPIYRVEYLDQLVP